jgi:hypothetical protein
MEIAGEHVDKKKALLYIGGAVASIVGLILIMRRAQSSQAQGAGSGGPPSGSGSNADAQLAAAQLNAQTALQIEAGKEKVAEDQIAASRDIALGAQSTALGVANTQAGASTKNAAINQAANFAKALGDALKGGPSPTAKNSDSTGGAFPAGFYPGNLSGFKNPQGGSVLDTDNPDAYNFGNMSGFTNPSGGSILDTDLLGDNSAPDFGNTFGYVANTGFGSSDYYGNDQGTITEDFTGETFV